MRHYSKKRLYKNLFAGIVGILSLIILFFFPVHTMNSIWKGYRVLVVPLEQNEQNIVSKLAKLGIIDIVTESNSQIANINPITPSQTAVNKWNKDRLSWFQNKSQNCRYFFLAETPFLEAKIKKALSGLNFTWNLEHADSIALLPVIMCSFFLLVCVFVSKQRIFFLSFAVPFTLYSFFCNTISGYATSVFSILFLFIMIRIFEPENKGLSMHQRIARIQKNWIFLLSAPVIVVIASTGGLHSFLLFLVILTLSASVIILTFSLKEQINLISESGRIHPVFRPVMINPDMVKKTAIIKKELYILLTSCVLFSVGLLFFRAENPKNQIIDQQELYIPSPSGYTKTPGFTMKSWIELSQIRTTTSLPDLGTYTGIRWNLDTAPWKRIQETVRDPLPGEVIGNSQFIADKNGVISGKMNTMFTFDTMFIKKILSSGTTPLETMLIRQGRFMTVEVARQER